MAREPDLDLRAETPQDMELLITGLQSRVTVAGGRDNIFSISYADANREKAREVVAALLNTFMESSLGAQGDDAAMTERALSLEIEDHEPAICFWDPGRPIWALIGNPVDILDWKPRFGSGLSSSIGFP